MKSPLHSIGGFAGASQHESGPIPPAEAPLYGHGACRVLVSGGQWGPDATAGDRARLAARLAAALPCAKPPKPRPAAGIGRISNPRRNVRQRDHLIPRIVELRAQNPPVPWERIGKQFRIPKEAARRLHQRGTDQRG